MNQPRETDPCQSERDQVDSVTGQIRELEDFLPDAPDKPKIRAQITALERRKAFLAKKLDDCVDAHRPPPEVKCIAVKLASIVCESNGFGGTISLEGNVFGMIFERQTGQEVSRKDIFPFPSGPLTIQEGQTLPIRMDESVTFCGPTTRFLKVGGQLNHNLGSNFIDLDFFDEFPTEPPQIRSLELKTTNLTIALRFAITMQTPS